MKSAIAGIHSLPHSPTLTLAPTLLKKKCNFVFQVQPTTWQPAGKTKEVS
jgi:hypothetical protein